MSARQWNIGSITKKRAMLSPDKTAIIYEGRTITYKALNDGANRVAHYLQEKGLKKGDRISVLLFNCPEFLEVYFAAAKLGIIFVPLNFRLIGPELEYQLNNCESRLLVFHDTLIENIESVRSNTKVDEDKFLYLKSGLPNCAGCPEWATDYKKIVESCSMAEPIPREPIYFDDPLCIMYTSGVTGAPKGAVLSHQQTYFKNFQIILYTDMSVDDRFLAQSPLFHSAGLFFLATPVLCCGATMIVRQSFEPEQFTIDIGKYKPTIIFCMTAMWKMILETKRLDSVDTTGVRVVVGGGEKTPLSLFDELSSRGLHMQMGYGQTENSVMMIMPKEYVEKKKGSIGKPGFFTDVWIAHKDGKKAAPGEIGEIVARGLPVMSGYWNMPDMTAKTIVDGVLHTGDLGYMDEDGFFYIVDRAKDMYRSGGENIYPAEVEKVLLNYPKILNIAIIGVPDERWGETGKAFIVLRAGETLTREEATEFLKGKVAKYKYPRYLEFVDQLPMTASGKVKKADLKKKYGVRLNA
ncbi:AMP-binding protein [Desulfobacula sp.]|uniref:AMP-binding protein n=1 Tax=Desulfobacula sp. TaxID=2593537 RepID=UPI0026194202|nr:AMP-binding protein [Desulfobacula sp.]